MFLDYPYASLESSTLPVPSYDRLITISFPLHQSSINALRMSTLLAVTWSLVLGTVGFAKGIMTQLSFCKFIEIISCDPVFRLA